MRRLMWFTIGFAVACGVCCFIPDPFGMVAAALLLISMVISGVLFGKRVVPVLAFIITGFAVGLIWFSVFTGDYLRIAAEADGSEQRLRIRSSDFGRFNGYGTSVDGLLELEGKNYAVRVYLDDDSDIQPGDMLTGSFQLRYTAGRGFEQKSYLRGAGVFFLAYAQDEIRITPGETTWRSYPAFASREISQLLEVFFPADTAPFAQALLLGDTNGLSYRQDTDLKLSGIRHVVAVSGLHVSILFALISTLTWKRPWLRVLVGFPVLLFFAAMTGFSPSVNRACIMCGLMMLSIVLRRDYDSATALSFSCLVMLIVNPLVMESAAFQLSVSCVAGIYLFRDKIRFWLLSKLGKCVGKGILPRLKRWLAGSIAVSLSAMVFSMPLSALYFGTVSLVGVLTNLLTLWVIGFVFCGALGVCLLGTVHSAAALCLAKVISIPIRYILLVAKVLGSLPMAAVYTQSVYIVLWLVFVYALIAVFALSKRRNVVITSCCAVVGLCIALTISWMEPTSDDVRLTVMDVGHGQCILLQWSGNTFLVDCGGDSATMTADYAAQTLLSQGISYLDGMIITHMDYDHVGGAEYLLSRIPAKRLILPETVEKIPLDGENVSPVQGLTFSADGGTLTVFGPISAKGGNENSLCVLFEGENCAILITGDRSTFGERMLMRHTVLPKVDVLIAGHHGSAQSTGYELLDQTQPEHVVISGAAADIRLLQRLAEYDCQIWRTDRCGTIIYRR